MDKQEAKQWAELLTALAEGKIVERKMINAADDSSAWVQVHEITTIEELDNYRIKRTPKKRRMNNVEAADWLRDNPQEHREFKYKESANESSSVWHEYPYDSGKENEPCDNILIRRNHGEWEEPLIVEE